MTARRCFLEAPNYCTISVGTSPVKQGATTGSACRRRSADTPAPRARVVHSWVTEFVREKGIHIRIESIGTSSERAVRKPSVLGHAILQLLTRRAASGYDLKKRFFASVGRGWHAYDTQIYRELKSLEDNGYVSGRVAKGRSGPQRRLYEITQEGTDSLLDWLVSPLELSKFKDEFGLRVWTADLFPPGEFEDFVVAAREQWRQSLDHQRAALENLNSEHGPPESCPPAVVGRQLAIEQTIAITEAKIAWSDRAVRIARSRTEFAAHAED